MDNKMMDIEERLQKEYNLYMKAYQSFDSIKEPMNILAEATPPNEYGQMLLNKRGNHKKKH